MLARDSSDFTMDIDINVDSLLPEKPSCSYSSNDDLACPVCGTRQLSRRLLELHATQCADNKFIEVYDIDDSSDDYEDLPEATLQPMIDNSIKQECDIDTETFIQHIKCELEKCTVEQKALKLKVRRGSAFTDFCERLDKKWIAKNIGWQLSIEFYGEIGIDQGGPKRDFFSGRKVKCVICFKLLYENLKIVILWNSVFT